MSPEWIGWLSSAILLATLVRQIAKQMRAARNGERSDGVSRWLFLGQCAASAGFVVYSLLVGNWVFVVTNACILITALIGQWLSARTTSPR